MKKILVFLITFFTVSTFAQYNPDAPWMQALGAKNGTATLEEIKASFDEYWKTHDPNVKGSGHKPFMRWYTNIENQRNDDGTPVTYDDLLEATKQKQQAKQARAVSITSNWTPIHGTQSYINTGSWSSGQGRIACITVAPSNANIIYVGTPAGGVWKSIDAGVTFIPKLDELPQIGVNAIAVHPSDPEILYVTTGDRDGGSTTSEGVYKSINGGTTWTLTGLTKSLTGNYAPELYINPSNANMLWCATNNGVYRTTDAGINWTKTLSTTNIRDFKIKPNDPTTLYASTATLLFRSTDSGATFTQVGTGLPTLGGRMVIAVTAANASVVYALSVTSSNALQGLYKSTDSGLNFTTINTTSTNIVSTQAWYDMAMTVSPTNENEIFTGFLDVYKSINGGTSFIKVNSWSSPSSASYTHADIHFLRYYGNKLYCGSDGGIYVSSNGGTNFTDLTKTMQIGQPYKISVAKQSSNKIISGLQDNGGHVYNGTRWQNYYGADGMDVAVDPTNQNLMFGFIQYGAGLYKTINGGATSNSSVSAPTAETGTNDSGGKWVTPLAINSIGEVFSAYKNFYKLVGIDWEIQNTTPNAIGTSDAELIAIDPTNVSNIFIANDSQLYKSTNAGTTFTLVHTALSSILGLTVHTTNSNIIYYNTSSTVYKSVNGGATFTAITTSGLTTVSKTCIAHQNLSTNPLYVGTMVGVYYIDDTLTAWVPFETGLPNTKVTDLEINYVDNNITAGTYGRGVWRSPLPAVLGTVDFMLNSIAVYPNPSKDIFKVRLGALLPQKIEISDLTGKVIFNQTNFDGVTDEIQLNLINYSNGVYLLKITADNQSVIKKLIKS